MRQLRSVLYVDDEPDIREIVALALGLDGSLSIRTCESGAAALEAAMQRLPDLVLLDVMMPDLDGPATLARFRAEPTLASVPIVFVTAKTMPSELQRFGALGAAGVISKPFDPMRLLEQVRILWERIHG
ncbi:MAG: response regulator [Steroidobacteraceae bacterium]|nr:response regulator [Steroidobacteraceae bacterium]